MNPTQQEIKNYKPTWEELGAKITYTPYFNQITLVYEAYVNATPDNRSIQPEFPD